VGQFEVEAALCRHLTTQTHGVDFKLHHNREGKRIVPKT